MVRGRIGLVEGDDEATTRAAVAAGVARWVPDETERRWIEHALLVLLGLEGSAGAAREELFSAWRTFFERIAANGPVVLLFEDLHWADAGPARLHRPRARLEHGRPVDRSSRSPGPS